MNFFNKNEAAMTPAKLESSSLSDLNLRSAAPQNFSFRLAPKEIENAHVGRSGIEPSSSCCASNCPNHQTTNTAFTIKLVKSG